MQKRLSLALIFGFISTTASAAVDWNGPKKQQPKSSLTCSFFLTHIPVVFEGSGEGYRQTYSVGETPKVIGDTGNVIAVDLADRRDENDQITIAVGSKVRKSAVVLPAFSRLDSILLDNPALYPESILNAVVTKEETPRVQVRLEKFEVVEQTTETLPNQAVIDMSTKIFSVETRRKSKPDLTPYLVLKAELEKSTHEIALYSEADSMIFLAAQKLRLKRKMFHLIGLQDSTAPNAFGVVAGAFVSEHIKIYFPPKIVLGDGYKISGIEQTRLAKGALGLTRIAVKNSTGLTRHLLARDYETGMKLLELAISTSQIPLKVSTIPRPRADGQGNEWIDIFEII